MEEKFFKKVKRILALTGAILLALLYACTLIFALTGNPNSMFLFKASILSTIIVPVLLWTYGFVYKLLKSLNDDNQKKGQP